MAPFTLGDFITAFVRRWWIVVLVPIVALAILVYRDRSLPYQATLRASVVIPGDTEIPGSAERPELMVMDDAPPLVTSQAFAKAVAAKIGGSITAGQVQSALSSSRYSRLLSITASSQSAGEATTIVTAAGAVLPAMINQYLVADAAHPATVQIIDQPSAPTRSRSNAKLLIVVETLVALVAGAFLAVAAEVAARWRATTVKPAAP